MSESTKVSKELIDVLMHQVEYEFAVAEGRTHCTAKFRNKNGVPFVLADGFSKPIDLANYNKEIAEKIALERAKKAAEDELYKLEGWKLFCGLGQEKTEEEATEEAVA